jgi:hypothetical protein
MARSALRRRQEVMRRASMVMVDAEKYGPVRPNKVTCSRPLRMRAGG